MVIGWSCWTEMWRGQVSLSRLLSRLMLAMQRTAKMNELPRLPNRAIG